MAEVLNIVEDLKQRSPQFRSRQESLVFLIHGLMRSFGFRLVGTSEEGNDTEDALIPSKQNPNQELFTFRYRHSESSLTFVLKFLPIGDKLLVHAFSKEESKIASIEIHLEDYVWGNVDQNDFEKLFRNQDKLVSEIKISIISKLAPGISKLGEQETSSSSSTTTSSRPSTSQPRPFVPQQPPPDRPLGPGFQPGYPEPRNPFQIGEPSVPFPFPRPGGSGFPDPDGFGNLVGPRHPGFHIPFPNPSTGLPRPLPPGAVPPGARFDPYGPPGTGPNGGFPGRFNQFGEPDPDVELPPSGYEDMYI